MMYLGGELRERGKTPFRIEEMIHFIGALSCMTLVEV